MEQRLIDANALCEEFKNRQQAALRWKEKAILDGDEERQIRADATLAFLSEVKLTIDNAPTVDERPKSEWGEPFFHNGKTYHRCYHCNVSSQLILLDYYCPNCGADMRGGRQ